MKLWKILMGFAIFYFIITALNGMIVLADTISLGNQWLKYGFYVLMLVLLVVYLVLPVIGYIRKPSMKQIELLFSNDQKAHRLVWKYLNKTLRDSAYEEFKKVSKDSSEALQEWMKGYIVKQTAEFDGIIKQFAIKLTATVMISPNPFIDGITILYGNSKMMYMLSKKMNFRYSLRELWDMYFAVMSVASVTGLLEEFDDVIEEMFEEVVEEFGEFIKEETGRSIGDAIPILNVLMKASGPIIQAAGNYAFIIYNGKRFKYSVLNIINVTKQSEEAIRKVARKEARQAKYKYIQDMIKKLGFNGSQVVKNQLDKAVIGVGKLKPKSMNIKRIQRIKNNESNETEVQPSEKKVKIKNKKLPRDQWFNKLHKRAENE